MEYKPYQHVERMDTEEVEGILAGKIDVMPKLDGSNGVCWLKDDGTVGVGNRKRELIPEEDNAGFAYHILYNPKYLQYLKEHPTYYLYGEWLVRNNVKYDEDAYKHFYVFDIYDEAEQRYLYQYEYKDSLEAADIKYIPVIATLENPSIEDIDKFLSQATFLTNGRHGEGIVIHNPGYKNKYGNVIWGKIIAEEFRKKKHRNHAIKVGLAEPDPVEKLIAEKYVTRALVEKEQKKIEALEGRSWNSKMIPKLLNTVYHEIITEECWNMLVAFKNPTINFRNLQKEIFNAVKDIKGI